MSHCTKKNIIKISLKALRDIVAKAEEEFGIDKGEYDDPNYTIQIKQEQPTYGESEGAVASWGIRSKYYKGTLSYHSLETESGRFAYGDPYSRLVKRKDGTGGWKW